MSWNSVIGQERVKDILRASIDRGRLAHAYLFSGPEGSGKYATALELAKIVNCERSKVEACDVCSSCRKFLTLQHPNLHLVFSLPVGKNEKSNDTPLSKLSTEEINVIQEQIKLKSENPYHSISVARANIIKINSIRDIRREASMTLFGSGKKVIIIIDAEKMNEEAANALLKTLEEPHLDTLLILLSSQPDHLLRTIISRCQQITFDSLTDEQISAELQVRKNVDPQNANVIARLSSGNFTRALQYTDSDFSERQSLAIDLLRNVLYKPFAVIAESVDGLVRDFEKNDIEDIFRLMQQWLYDAMVYKTNPDDLQKVVFAESMKKFVANYPQFDYASSIEALDRSVSLIDKNVYLPLIMFDLSTKLRHCIGNISK